MDRNNEKYFIYTYACSEREERSLCDLEMRSFFGKEVKHPHIIKSTIGIDADRSAFFRERVEVLYSGATVKDIAEQVKGHRMPNETFKLHCIKTTDRDTPLPFSERKEIEKEVGWQMEGQADLKHPDQEYGMILFEGRWHFGYYRKSEQVWLRQQRKPREYSTALSTRVARTVVNIAAPHPDGVRVIDPCCGIGTVIVEALSMGINITGRDINWIAADGAKENAAHFGFSCDIRTGPIEEITEQYDAAIVDMPYNLYTSATPEEQFSILESVARIAERAVIVTSENMDEMIRKAGLEIKDRCTVTKGTFIRYIMVCEKSPSFIKNYSDKTKYSSV